MKKCISFTLLLCLLASIFAISATAADERVFDDAKNLALNAKCEVSSENMGSEDNWGEAALNGEVSQTTRWGNWYSEEDGPGNTWFLIDFLTPRTFNRMTVVESANPALYGDNGKCEEWKVEISNDKKEWTQVANGNWLTKGPNTVYSSIHANLGNPYDIDFDTVEARYIRLSITKVRREIEGGGAEDLSNNLSFSIISVFNEPKAAAPVEAAPEPEVVDNTPAAVEAAPVAATTTVADVPKTGDATVLLLAVLVITGMGAGIVVKQKSKY